MEEKHDIVAPIFKAKGKPVSKAKISSRPVVKMVKRIPLSSTFAAICLYGAWVGDKFINYPFSNCRRTLAIVEKV